MGRRAAKITASYIRNHPYASLGFATGGTMKTYFAELVREHKQYGLDLSAVRATFNLDEYYPMKSDDIHSYHWEMYHCLFDHVNIDKRNIHILDGSTDNPKVQCDEFEKEIKLHGGIDLQVLGIGRPPYPHIGFNERGSSFDSPTRLVELTEETRKANARFFDYKIDKVPTHALTMGLATIMEAQNILVLACGQIKADSARLAFEDPITEEVPASILQMHPNVTVVADKDAASKLEMLSLALLH